MLGEAADEPEEQRDGQDEPEDLVLVPGEDDGDAARVVGVDGVDEVRPEARRALPVGQQRLRARLRLLEDADALGVVREDLARDRDPLRVDRLHLVGRGERRPLVRERRELPGDDAARRYEGVVDPSAWRLLEQLTGDVASLQIALVSMQQEDD